MNRHEIAVLWTEYVNSVRRRSAPVAVFMFATFLMALSPPWLRVARAAPGEPIETAPETSQGSAPASGMGSPSGADTSDTDADAPDLPVSLAGAFAYSFPFELPGARGETQPALGLTYGSGRDWGIAGQGFDLVVPFIERVPLPYLDAAGNEIPVDEAADPITERNRRRRSRYITHRGEDLIPVVDVLPGETLPAWSKGWTYYRPRVETTFDRYFLSPDHKTWRVQLHGAPVDLEYGQALDGTHDAREEERTTWGTHRYWLVRAYDGTNGAREQAAPTPTNAVLYRYMRGAHETYLINPHRAEPEKRWRDAIDEAPLYLSDVYATSPREQSTSTDVSTYAAHVHLAYEKRKDAQPIISWGKKIGRRELRLARVDVTSKPFSSTTAPRTIVRRYHLAYNDAASAYASVLRSVEMEGACDTPTVEQNELLGPTTCPRLPPTTFGYESHHAPRIPDLVSHLGKLVKARAGVGDHVIRYVDVNHDSLVDILITAPFDNGQHALYLNGLDGKAGTFKEVEVPFAGVLGDTADNLAARTAGVYHGDFDGNGRMDMLVAPPGEPARVYELRGAGTSWSWAGRELPSFPELPQDGNARVADVNHDGATDLLVTTGKHVQTYFSLARVPGGADRFGSVFFASDEEAAELQLSPRPARAPLPRVEGTDEPLPLAHANIHLADVNGDKRLDYVYVAKDGVHVWEGTGSGLFGVHTHGDPTATNVERSALHALGDKLTTDAHTLLRFGDFDGDGFDDLVQVTKGAGTLWTNQHGEGFAGEKLRAPNVPPASVGFVLADLFGSGFVGGVWDVGGKVEVSTKVPNAKLLSTVSNGYGGTTKIAYELVTALELQKRAGGARPEMAAPFFAVTSIKASDNLSLVGGTTHETVTQLAYDGAYIAPEDKRFKGFRTVTATRVGDASHPTEHRRVSSFMGECQDDPDTAKNDCGGDMDLWGNPREPLAMRPYLVERFDDAGVYRSTTAYAYRLRKLYSAGALRRGYTRHLHAEKTTTHVYASAKYNPSTLTSSRVAVTTEGVRTVTEERIDVPIRSIKWTQISSGQVVDLFGHNTDRIAYGRVGQDAERHVHRTWSIPSGDTTGWTFRPVRRWTTGVDPNVITRDASTVFDREGKPTEVSAVLTGTLDLVRTTRDPANPPQAPASASTNGRVILSRIEYDELGNPTLVRSPNHRCVRVEMDSVYGTLPTASTQYTGPLGPTLEEGADNACGSVELKSFATFDRGLSKIKDSLGYHGEKARAVYDGFGRQTAVYKPKANATTPGELATKPAVKFTYYVTADVPLQRALVESLYVDASGAQGYLQAWALTDGFGRSVATITQADTSAGDGANWIVSGVHTRNARGAVASSFLPFFWNGMPRTALLDKLAPTSKSTRLTRDAFGRTVDTYGVDGARTSHRDYLDALTVNISDAEDLAPMGTHANTPASVRRDGFGQIISDSVLVRAPGAQTPTAQETKYTYDLNGALTQIERVKGTSSVVRTMRYDSLGRLVENLEPNTSARTVSLSFVTAGAWRHTKGAWRFTTRGWRYAYNDSGALVGTSDARGCGKNLYYDAGGRKIAEDFVPCEASHAPYSKPDLTTGEGTEAFYRYDTLPSDGSGAVLNPNANFALGRLTAVYDRAGSSALRYDSRGRTTGMAKRLAKPDYIVAEALGDRYTPHWFLSEVAFNEDETTASSSTGVDAELPELLGEDGKSTVTPVYSLRGVPVGVESSYGTLIKSSTRSAEGLNLATVYGDAAETTTATTYDEQLRVHTVETARAKATGWSAEPAAISPPPSSATTQLILESLEYAYDRVGNPLTIQDNRDASEWPSGAKPASHAFTYDDLYRLTGATTTYAGGDGWTSPFEAETTRTPDDSARDRVAPHLKFDARIKRQTWAYDYLGNTTKTTDDAHGFADRSLGTITNGSASEGPDRLLSASDPDHGSLAASYDAAGHMTGLTVEREGTCLPAGASCSQRYAYTWDEVGQLARAQRWDVAGTAETFGADLHYTYDAGGTRVRKTASPAGAADRHTLYVFGSLELRRALFDGTDYERTIKTTAVRLGGLARVIYADEGLPQVSSGKQHVFLTLPGHLGSTATVIDRDTGELVEKTAYQPSGAKESDYRPDRWASFREELGFTGKEEDTEVGLLYFGARYLVPALGRWASPDPLTVHAAGADLNPYAYVGGRTTVGTDPDGLDTCIGSNCPNGDTGSGNNGGTKNQAEKEEDIETVYVTGPKLKKTGGESSGAEYSEDVAGDKFRPGDRGGAEGEGGGGRTSPTPDIMNTVAGFLYAVIPLMDAEGRMNIPGFEKGYRNGKATLVALAVNSAKNLQDGIRMGVSPPRGLPRLAFAPAGGGPAPAPAQVGVAVSPLAAVALTVGIVYLAENGPKGILGDGPAVGGKGSFPNQLPERLANELATAARVGAGPIRAGTPAFEAALNEGEIKWVVTESGELLISPHTVNGTEISHAVLSGGRPVLAAGQADIASAGGRFIGMDISPHSGHFMPSTESLQIGVDAFAKLGIHF